MVENAKPQYCQGNGEPPKVVFGNLDNIFFKIGKLRESCLQKRTISKGAWSRGMIFASHVRLATVKGRGFNSHSVQLFGVR